MKRNDPVTTPSKVPGGTRIVSPETLAASSVSIEVENSDINFVTNEAIYNRLQTILDPLTRIFLRRHPLNGE